MSKILIPFDGSEPSKNAIFKGMASGIFKDAEIHIITVIPSPVVMPTKNSYIGHDMLDAIAKANKTQAEEVMETAKAIFKEAGGVASAVIKEGDPAEEILTYADELNVDMIVMGNRGLGTFRKILLGSVSSKVVSNASCSVLIFK